MLESSWLANWVLIGFFLIGVLVVIGVAVKVIDLRRKRAGDAVHLQAVISDALLREPSLSGLAVTPTVSIPFWRGSPATITVSGTVPTSERREAVMRVIRSEASRIRSDIDIDDCLAISPMTRAAS